MQWPKVPSEIIKNLWRPLSLLALFPFPSLLSFCFLLSLISCSTPSFRVVHHRTLWTSALSAWWLVGGFDRVPFPLLPPLARHDLQHVTLSLPHLLTPPRATSSVAVVNQEASVQDAFPAPACAPPRHRHPRPLLRGPQPWQIGFCSTGKCLCYVRSPEPAG